jgi:hypothetical protein
MMIKSLQQVESLNSTIRKVDNEIVKRLKAIRRNVVPNAAIARNHVRTLQRENEQRKAVLHLNKGRIEQLYEADGGRYSKMRRTFLTPDGPKEKGPGRRQRVSINEAQKARQTNNYSVDPKTGEYYWNGRKVSKSLYMTLMSDYKQKRNPRQPLIRPTPPTSKQRKRVSPPPKDIEVIPLPKVTPTKPPTRFNEAADSIRQNQHRMAADRATAIRRVQDAKRDAELVRRGQMDLVTRRRNRELAQKNQEAKMRNSRLRDQRLEEMKNRAINAEKTARAQATSIATRNVAVRPSRSRPSASFSRGNGIVPQLALMTALSDKNRAANLNKTTRTKETVPQGPIADQITEDVRKFKPVTHSWSKEYKEVIAEVIAAEKQGRKMIADALAGREVMGFTIDIKALGRERTKYWVNRAYALMAQVKKIVLDEAIRWDKGSLSAGVNISTESRSQSSRKMTFNEFNRYLEGKLEPIVEPVINEFMEELQRVHTAQNAKQPSNLGASRNITIHAGTQKALSGIDKLRGHGRPVLSEQQGTKGLAGLFPALRSSMQGALRQ